MKSYTLIFFIVLLFSEFTIAQNNKDIIKFNEGNLALQDSNITLMSFYPFGSCNGVFVRDNYAYIGRGSTLEVVDISSPDEPVSMGCVLLDYLIDGIYISSSYAYVVSIKGLYVIDISEPTNPSICGYLNPWVDSGFKRVVVSANFAYLLPSANNQYEIYIVDISDPYNPVEVGHYNTGQWVCDLQVTDSLAFITSAQGLHIVNVIDPQNPFQIGFYQASINESFYNLCLKDDNAFITGSFGNMHIVDVSNPYNPNEIGLYQTGSNFLKDLSITNNYAFIFGSDSLLYVVDISNPANPIEISSYLINDWTEDIFSVDNYVFVTGLLSGLYIIDVSDPFYPVLVGFHFTGGFVWDIYVKDNYAYLTSQQNSYLSVVDIGDPSNPKLTGYCHLNCLEPDVFVKDNLAFVAGGSNDLNAGSLHIIDVSIPSSPIIISQYSFEAPFNSIYVSGDYAYTTTTHQLQIFDISDPINPVLISDYFLGDFDWTDDLYVSGNYAFIAGHYYIPWLRAYIRLFIVNISDPFNPVIEGIYEGSDGSATDIYAENNYAFLVCSLIENRIMTYSWLYIFDVSNPVNPTIIGEYFNENQFLSGIHIKDDYAYLLFSDKSTAEKGGLLLLDVSQISNPREAGIYEIIHWGRLFAYDEYVCLTNRIAGLFILRNDLITSVNYYKDIPTSFSLSQNFPNPFNPNTKIKYSVPQTSQVIVKAFDVLGNEISTLINEEKPAGTYKLTWNAANLPSGVYFYQLRATPNGGQAGSFVETKKMILLR